MVLPKPFTTTAPVIASFSFTEIISGTGIQSFYFAQDKDDSAAGYFMTENSSIFSFEETFALDGFVGSNTDLDYDLSELNVSRTIKGTATFNMPWYTASDGIASTGSLKFDVILRKWDGTTETDIVTATTETKTNTHGGGGFIDGNPFCLNITVPRTRFNKGDILRVTLKAYPTRGNSQIHLFYGSDPANTSSAASGNTRSTIFIPFEIDL